jgi:hypothetical protein
MQEIHLTGRNWFKKLQDKFHRFFTTQDIDRTRASGLQLPHMLSGVH